MLNLHYEHIFRGFTKFSRNDYVKWKSENRILPDGVNGKVLSILETLFFTYALNQQIAMIAFFGDYYLFLT